MKKFVILTFVMLTANIQAQEEKAPEYGWKNTLVTGLNVTHVSLHNWVQGGENTLAWTLLTNGRFEQVQENFTWTNNLKLTYGQAKIGSREFEKTDDEFFFESIYAHNLRWAINPFAAFTVRTQIAPGYKLVNEKKTQTSAFFDPGYLIQSVGFMYAQGDFFSTRLGVAVKETFTSKFSEYKYADDPKTLEIEKNRVQTGIESGTFVKYGVMENILYTSQLNLFSAFNQLDIWDVRWDNTLVARVNNYVNVSLNVLLVHEIAQSRRTQVKQTLALGLTYILF